MNVTFLGEECSYVPFAYIIVTFHKYVATDIGIAKVRSVYPEVGLFKLSLVIHIIYFEIFVSVAMNQPKFLNYFSEKTKCFQTTIKSRPKKVFTIKRVY